ncbi:restriction endonuclease subunit S [Zhongshania marina]|uniref:Restriction endonuclease subunit S n=1 Tax=Zhongshania marina TaxID=2304603 RepID=A0ABX9W173_9GAMM|nr:restriction endonuclease subunit S [Zhongshania marina]
MSKLQTTPSGWKLTTLGTFMEFKNGVNADKNAYGSGTEFVNVMDIFKRNFMKKCNILGKVEITEKQKAEYSVKYGDILFNRTSEVPDEIAFSSVYLDEAEITFGGFVIRGRQKKELLDPLFAGYCFNNSSIRREMIRRSQGVVRANIGQKDLNKVPILIPPKDEQKKIASVLALWDNAIEKTEALIAAKEKQFEWLLNNLIEDDFKSCKKTLSEYASIAKKEKILSADGEKLLTVKLHCKGIEPNTRDIKVVLSSKGRPYYQRLTGEFLIGRQNFHNGGFGIVPSELDGFIASNAITTLELNQQKLIPEYLFFHFSRKNYYLRVGHIMDGTGQKELSDKQIMKLPISAPSIKVQQDIVLKLSSAKEEIKLLQTLLDKYRSQKRGLMQKLLTGEWQMSSSQLAAEGKHQELTKENVA